MGNAVMKRTENKTADGWEWDESEYSSPCRHRLKMERQAYEAAEREDRENDIPFNIVGF